MATRELEAEQRTVLGKKVRNLRKEGLVPANLYGRGQASVPLQLGEKVVQTQIARSSRSTLYSLAVSGADTETVLVKDVQRHPISGAVLHVDFLRIAMTEMLRTSVPLLFVGEPPAVKSTGGTPMHNLTQLDVSALPADLPTSIEVDVSSLESLEDSIFVRDLTIPRGVEVHTDPDELVAKVLAPTVAVEEEAAPEVAAAVAETAEGQGEAEAESEPSASE